MNKTVSKDSRVQKLVELLYGVDFGVNMNGWDRARIAQVILDVLEAERTEIVAALRKAVASATRHESYGQGLVTISVTAAEDAVDQVRNRYHPPDLTTKSLWQAAQPRKDWIEADPVGKSRPDPADFNGVRCVVDGEEIG
jgi:hypothetical protein